METHVKVLGVLYLVFGVLGLLVALFVLLATGGVASLIGASAVDNPDALAALPIIGIGGTFVFLFFLILSLPAVFAGIGLLKFRPWARVLGIVLSALNLINLPFGTVLGVYGLWVLLSKNTESLFAARAVPSI